MYFLSNLVQTNHFFFKHPSLMGDMRSYGWSQGTDVEVFGDRVHQHDSDA
jgi:hypothetical protein